MGDDRFQHPCHAPAGEACIYLQCQALTGEGIHHAQNPNGTAGSQHIMGKIKRPLLVGSHQLWPRRSDANTMSTLLPLQAKPRLAIHPQQPLVVHSLSLTLHQYLQSPVPVARLLSGQLHQLLPEQFIRSTRTVLVTRYRHRHQPAHPALTGFVLTVKPLRIRPPVYELRPFFAITAFSISLSRLRSATNRFKREFSSSNDRKRCASLASIPPNFAFHP